MRSVSLVSLIFFMSAAYQKYRRPSERSPSHAKPPSAPTRDDAVIVDDVIARLSAQDVLPSAILRRVDGRSTLLDGIRRYVRMADDDLHHATEVCLRNLNPLDSDAEHDLDPDAQIRIVLVPEFWERIRPGSRYPLRRISTRLAEYDPAPDQPSFWRHSRLWSAEHDQRLRESAIRLREEIARAATLDIRALVEQARFAIAGSHASDQCPPDHPVYEPGFTYRLIPAVAWRALAREARAINAEAPSGETPHRKG